MSQMPLGQEACFMQGCMSPDGDCVERWRSELAAFYGSEADADATVLAYGTPCVQPAWWDAEQRELYNAMKHDDVVDAWITADTLKAPGGNIEAETQTVVAQRDYTWYIGAGLAGAMLLFAANKMR